MQIRFVFVLILLFGFSYVFGQSQPSPILPYENLVTMDTTIQIKWSSNYYYTPSFQLQISTDQNFSMVLLDSNLISSNFINYTFPFYNQDYYWRVRFNNGTISSTWSNTGHFKIFNPVSIGGLTAWIDPNTDVLMNGTGIQQISDQSGLNNNSIQLNSILQPTLISSDSTINYKSLMRYDGSNDFMEILDNNSLDYVSEFSFFLLYQPSVISVNRTFLSKWDYPTQGTWAWQTGFNVTDEMLYSPAAFLTEAAPTSVTTTNADLTLKPTFLELEFNGAEPLDKIKFFKDFNLVGAGISAGFGSTLPNSTASIKIGRYGGSVTRYMNGKIGEILMYNNILTVNEKEDVESYLRYKYSPPVSLGNDTILAGNSLCGSISLSPQKPFSSYLWSTGQTTKTIVITNPGEYWLQTIDFFGFVSRDTLVVYPPYNVNLPASDTTICLGSSINWVTDFPSSNFTFLWQDNSVNTNLTINTSGNYYVKIFDLLGCSIVSDTMHVDVDQYPINMSLGNDTTLCSSNLIELVSGAGETISYTWNDNTTLTNLPIYSSGNYWLQSTNINGCVAQDTINVIVSGTAPTAIFTGQDRCLGLANSFTDGSAGVVGDPVTSWTWDFGDGLGVSIAQNPSYTYATPGSYTVELYALSQGGCGSYHTVQIEVFAPPVASYTYTGSCSDQEMQFTNQSVVGGAAINQYAWNFGQPSLGAQNVSSVQNPYRSFPTGGTYPMSLTVTDAHLCVDDTVMQIVVNASPIIDVFAADACTGAPIQFTNNTVVQSPATYLWNFGDNTTSILPLPNKQYSTEGLKTITVKVTASNGCFTSDTIEMTVHSVPVASFDLGPHCKGSYTEVQSTSTISTGSIADLFWVVNLTDTLYGDPAGYVISNLNQQQIQLFIASDFGCTDDQNLFFDPEGAITASFTYPSPVAAVGDTVEFTNTSIGATNFTWNFGDGNSLIQENPSHVYSASWEDSTVVVELIVSNALGCIDTAQLTIPIVASIIDLKLNTVFVQQNGSVAILGAQLKNNGNLPITHADLTVYSEDGLIFSEPWDGLLVAGDDIIYVLSGQPSYPILAYDELNSYYCIQSVGYSGLNIESDLTNNEACKNIESNEVILKPVYPNPTGTTITLGLIVPKSADISADLVDDQGRVVKQLIYPFTLATGEYTYVFDLTSIANGTYAMRFTADGKTELHRVVVLR
jgi:PKD repeat protein